MNNIDEKQIRNIELSYDLEYNKALTEFKGLLCVDYEDFYDISINVSSFPNSFPIVKELGERIPFELNRHKYKDASCCLTTKAKEQLLLKKKIKSLDDFIKRIVIPFFQNNSYFEIKKCYINGDYKHGSLGIIEAYQEILNIQDIYLLLEVLINYIKGKAKLQRNEPCFCGSGRNYKHCHYSNYKDLCLIEKETIIHDLDSIFKFIKKTV